MKDPKFKDHRYYWQAIPFYILLATPLIVFLTFPFVNAGIDKLEEERRIERQLQDKQNKIKYSHLHPF